MQIEVAVTEYKKMDVVKALSLPFLSWDFEIVSGIWAEKYYLAEKDDVILEVLQESIGGDGSINLSTLFYLECADLPKDATQRQVLEYVAANQDRIIDYQKIWEYI